MNNLDFSYTLAAYNEAVSDGAYQEANELYQQLEAASSEVTDDELLRKFERVRFDRQFAKELTRV